jgi:hypothetical protein
MVNFCEIQICCNSTRKNVYTNISQFHITFYFIAYIYIYIIQLHTALYFISLYYIINPATCFVPICEAIFRLIFELVEYTINNAFNSFN